MATTSKRDGKPRTAGRKPSRTPTEGARRARAAKRVDVDEAQIVGEAPMPEAAHPAAALPESVGGVDQAAAIVVVPPPVALATVAPPPSVASPLPITTRGAVLVAAASATLLLIGTLIARAPWQRPTASAASSSAPIAGECIGADPQICAPVDQQPGPALVEIERALGHRMFAEGKRLAALRAYERTLTLDAGGADAQMIANLVSCYGFRATQPDAAAIIARFRLRAAEKSLEGLTRRGSHGTRWGAIYTLERLDRVPHRTYVDAFIADLQAPSCDVRRHAAERLGAIGEPRAAAALKDARERDHAQTPWYRSSCLGRRAKVPASGAPSRG